MYVRRQDIIDYVENSEYEYNISCAHYTGTVNAIIVASVSFKLCPSLTYLDMSTCEYTSTRKAILTWINWKKLIDDRLEIIYRLDLEDKYQFTKCSSSCVSIYAFYSEYTLDFDGFPGYYRIHGMNEPEDYDFSSFQTLGEAIKRHCENSNDKGGYIRRVLPTIQRFNEWFGLKNIEYLNTFFLKISFENKAKDFFLIEKLLEYSNTSVVWNHIHVAQLKTTLETNEMKRLINRNIHLGGNCGLVLDFLCYGDFLKIDIFIRHGLYPLNEKGIVVLKESDNMWESYFFYKLRRFFQEGFPGELLNYVDFSNKLQLTNIQILVCIALFTYKIPDCLETMKMLWRCIPTVYLTFEDFQNLFRQLPDSTRMNLRNIYFWYRGVLNADKETTSPRTLQHYCRCAIRKRLRENLDLPNGIDKLSLPKPLKKYLLLES